MKKLGGILLFCLFLATISTIGWCDEPKPTDQPLKTKSQEELDQDFAKMSQKMTPMFGDMVESMMQGKLKVFAKPETTSLLAKFVRNFYDDLISEGFTKEEALKIVTSFGFPAIQ